MFDYLEGKIVHHIQSDACSEITLDLFGHGYRIFVSQLDLSTVLHQSQQGVIAIRNEKDQMRFYIYYHVREGVAPELYGFSSRRVRDFFVILLDAPGIGPKIAMGIIDRMSPHEAAHAIMQGEVQCFTAVNGIGKRIAERLLLELKGKVSPFIEVGSIENKPNTFSSSQVEAALQALVNLGHSTAVVRRVFNKLLQEKQVTTIEELIRHALMAMEQER
jgi:Holliday junction DNA helicase RuvA